MKIYTKTGDKGLTGLVGGARIPKNHLRIEAYGTVDELNASLGFVLTHTVETTLKIWLVNIQNQLFVLGSDLATPEPAPFPIPRISTEMVTSLEKAIDEMDAKLPALKHFILPSGSPAGALLHVARTVCRRAERLCVDVSQHEDINPLTIIFLNRLSDFLFVAARFQNQHDQFSETIWKP